MKKTCTMVFTSCLLLSIAACNVSSIPETTTKQTTHIETATKTTQAQQYPSEIDKGETLPSLVKRAVQDVVSDSMTFDALLLLLKKQGENYNAYIMNNAVTENISLSYYYEGEVAIVLVHSAGATAPQTLRGVKIGDNKEKIVELYGDEYEKRVEYETVEYLEYNNDDTFMMFEFDENSLLRWSLSNKKLIDFEIF